MKIRFKKNKKFPKNFFKKNKIRPFKKNPEKDFQGSKQNSRGAYREYGPTIMVPLLG